MFFDLSDLKDGSYQDGVWKTLSELEQKGSFMKGKLFDVVFSAKNKIIVIYRIKK